MNTEELEHLNKLRMEYQVLRDRTVIVEVLLQNRDQICNEIVSYLEDVDSSIGDMIVQMIKCRTIMGIAPTQSVEEKKEKSNVERRLDNIGD